MLDLQPPEPQCASRGYWTGRRSQAGMNPRLVPSGSYNRRFRPADDVHVSLCTDAGQPHQQADDQKKIYHDPA